jgi:hypothetical protein
MPFGYTKVCSCRVDRNRRALASNNYPPAHAPPLILQLQHAVPISKQPITKTTGGITALTRSFQPGLARHASQLSKWAQMSNIETVAGLPLPRLRERCE